MSATGIPVAVVGSANNLSRLVIPKSVKSLLFLVDEDPNWVGQNAAIEAVRHYKAQGYNVRLVAPSDQTFNSPRKKKDFNDLQPEEIQVRLRKARSSDLAANRTSQTGEKGPSWIDVDSNQTQHHDPHQYAVETYPLLSFPWEVLPPGLEDCIKDVAGLKGVKPHCLVGAIFATLASLLAGRVNIQAQPEWNSPLIFFFCDLIPSGGGKTPALHALVTMLCFS